MSYRTRGRCQLGKWLVAASLAAALMPAFAAPTADWSYRVRPGDNIWDLAARFLKPDVPWQKLQGYNNVADPLHLPPGMTMHVPVAWLRLRPAPAKIIAVMGNATAKPADGSPAAPVVQGMSVSFGTDLVTLDGASLTLELADGSRVLMQSDSELSLDRLSEYGGTGMVDTRMRLKRGRINSDVIPLNGNAARFSVSTPNTISSVRGTHFRVIANDDDGTARTEVVSGRVDVGNEKRHVMVKTGLGVATSGNAAPGRPEALLSAPELHCPQEPVNQVPFEFQWTALEHAQHYRVQIAPSAKFEALLLDQVIDENRINLPDLGNGGYAIRVRGIGNNQLEGLDATCMLAIAANPQPPLVLEPQPNSKVRDVRPAFRWTESQQAVSYVWQLSSDPAFAQLLADDQTAHGDGTRAPQPLSYGRYFWRVASRDAQGKIGPYTKSIPFELVPNPPAPEPGAPKHERGDLVLSWPEGTPGQHYHIQLSRKNDFSKLLVDDTVSESQLSLKKLPSGKWYVRVQTIDTDGYAGPWGPIQRTRIPCTACRWVEAGGGVVLLWLVL